MDKEKEDKDYDTLYNIENDDSDNLYRLPDDFDTDETDDNRSEEMEEYDSTDPSNEETDSEEELEDDSEDSEDEDDEEETDKKRGSAFALLFKILSTPVEGWKELKRRKYLPEDIASGIFFPSIALASISVFAEMIYTTVGVSECLMGALNAFISFFFGYFTVILLSGIILPKSSKGVIKKDIGKEFVMVNLSTLALFYAAIKLFPMIDPVLVFLPIWTIYLIYKGVRILRIPEGVETRTKILFTFLIIGAPLLWSYLMDIFFSLSI